MECVQTLLTVHSSSAQWGNHSYVLATSQVAIEGSFVGLER